MKIVLQIKFMVLIVLVCSLYGQEETSEKAPLIITLTPVKQQYKIRENWEYEIRIKNISYDTVRIQKNIDSHYLPKMIDSNGQAIPWECDIVSMYYFEEDNTFELAPGYFYGRKCSWSGLEQPGEYTFNILYCSPKNLNDSLPNYWEGQIISNKVQIMVK